MANIVFTNVRIFDGTGEMPYQGEVQVQGNRIQRVARGNRSIPSSGLTVIDGGSAGEAILQAAHRLGADAIALASHGRSGVVRTLMGSVAEAVLRGSDKPVFVVRPRAG